VAQHRVWLTDAYFMGTTTYLEAISAAASQGVDGRILLPNTRAVPGGGNSSRTLYRRLLQCGVRIFEWNGTMIHAKTAVADGRIVRVGSTNLNLASWIGNWELDVVLDDEGMGQRLEEHYLEDLEQSTEIRFDRVHRHLSGRR